MISTITLDTYKQQIGSGDAFNLSDSFNGRVGDEQVPLVVQFQERGLAQQFQDGLVPFLTGFVGSLDENGQVTAETGEAVSYVGTSDDIVGLGRVKMNLPGTMFPQEGFFYGFLGLQNADGKRVTTFNVWFHVYNGNPDMFVNKAPFRTELQKLLDSVQSLINDANGDLNTWKQKLTDLFTTLSAQGANTETLLTTLQAQIKQSNLFTQGQMDELMGTLSNFKPVGANLTDKLNNEFNDRGVNVKWFGAVGDGVADDTKAIQAAIDSLGKIGGTILIPNGIYMIKADAPEQKAATYLSDAGGISVPSNTTINLAPGAELKAIPTDEGAYNVIRLVGVHDVIISGGKIMGERDLHTPKIGPTNTVGEWGYGIALQGSSNIVIRDISLTDFWGDGINIQAGVDEKTICQNVTIDNVICDNNRRQGMSIEALEHGIVRNSIFKNTVGTAPACGIDLEPAYDVIVNNDILIENNQFLNNDNCGLLVTRANCNKQIKVKDNYFVGNSGNPMAAQLFAQLGDDILIENNDFLGNDNCYYGISVKQFNNVNVINNQLKDAGFTSDGDLIDGVITSNQFIMTKLIKNITFQLSDGSRNFTISNNIFNGTDMPAPTTDTPDMITAYFKGTSLEIINNTLINQAFGIFAACDSSRIDGNHIHASHYAGIQSQGASTDIVNNVISGSCSLNNNGEAIVITKKAIGNYVANNIIRKQSAVDYPAYFKSTSNPTGTVIGYVKQAILLDNADHSNPLYTTLNSNHVYGDSNMLPYYLTDSNFRYGLVLSSQVVGAGATNTRPLDAITGSVFFDTDLGKPIFCKADQFTSNGAGQTWVDSTGTKV